MISSMAESYIDTKELEREILMTAFLEDIEATEKLFNNLRAEDFGYFVHKKLFNAMKKYYKSNKTNIDPNSFHVETEFLYVEDITKILSYSINTCGEQDQQIKALKKARKNEKIVLAINNKDFNKARELLNESEETTTAFYKPDKIKKDSLNYYTENIVKGLSAGWKELDKYFTVAPGQMTVMTGIPSSGKSNFVDAMIIRMSMEHEWKFVIYSPENQPIKYHLKNLIENCSNRKYFDYIPNEEKYKEIGKWANWINDHIFIVDYDSCGGKLDNILEVIEKNVVIKKKIYGFVIDPWNELNHEIPAGMFETKYIEITLTKIKRFCIKHKLHGFIVAHPTKLQKDEKGKYPVPTPYDISGSAHWFGKPDNCLCIHRGDDPDVDLHIQKIKFRNYGNKGIVHFEYQRETGNYEVRKEIQEKEDFWYDK
jgi:hypothetical protein